MKQTQHAKQTASQSIIFTQQLAKNISLLAHSVAHIRNDVLREVEENPALELQEEPDHESLEVLQYSEHSGGDAKRRFEFIESRLISPRSLSEYLSEQLHLSVDKDAHIEIGERIIGNIDDHGFYAEPPHQLCSTIKNISDDDIEEVLQILHTLDPVGCATSGVAESLAVQIAQLSIDEDIKNMMLKCVHLLKEPSPQFVSSSKTQSHPTLSQKQRKKLLDEYLSNPKIQELFRSLTPYPGLAYSSHFDAIGENYIIPDAFVERHDNESLRVLVNDTIIPVVSVSKKMEKASLSDDKETAQFASRLVQDAQSFMTGLQYRAISLEKVIGFIAHYHADFFMGRKEHPQPLTRAHIAQKLSLNESTVSRIISGKYIQTPRGMYEIKYFVSLPVGTSSVSAQLIKEKIQRIVTRKTQRLSDQKIADILSEDGITIARRTVAKYRGQLTTEGSQ